MGDKYTNNLEEYAACLDTGKLLLDILGRHRRGNYTIRDEGNLPRESDKGG